MADFEKASDFLARNHEANFGPPIEPEVVGGTHIAFELITHRNGTFFATRWPAGLPRHDDPPNALRFPHGLIQFGETIDDCSRRLVRAQLGMNAVSSRVIHIDSYLDDHKHWHIEPWCIVAVDGTPTIPANASEIVSFTAHNVPDMTFWSKDELLSLLRERAPQLLNG